MKNLKRELIIISLIVIVISLIIIWSIPAKNQKNTAHIPQSVAPEVKNNATTTSSDITPKVMTFNQFFDSLTQVQKDCYIKAIGQVRAGELLKGSTALSDNEIEQLNICSN